MKSLLSENLRPGPRYSDQLLHSLGWLSALLALALATGLARASMPVDRACAALAESAGTDPACAHAIRPAIGAADARSTLLKALAKATGQQAQLLASDGVSGDQFGYAVALSGDTALVGAPRDDGQRGGAYVFVRSAGIWTQQAKLVASDGASNDQFGYAVALHGDTAVIGAYLDDVVSMDQGSAYIFVRSGSSWSEQAKLTAADAAINDQFGISVGLSGNSAVVGAYFDDLGANANQGSAYVFVRNGVLWSAQAKLTDSAGVADDLMGWAVAIDGDTVLAGAWGAEVGVVSAAGVVPVFVRNGSSWSQQARLSAADPGDSDLFGYSVALDEHTALVGAFADDSPNFNQGSAYVHTRNGAVWTQQAKLTAADGASSDLFGLWVALERDTALVSAFEDDVGTQTNQGSAYVFERVSGVWAQQSQLNAGDGAAFDEFGIGVALDRGTALVGARFAGASNQGAAYAYVGEPSNTVISSALPDPARRLEAVTVRVAVRATPPALGNPSGTVLVRDGTGGALGTSTCTITLLGVADEVGQCELRSARAGNLTLTADYLGNLAFAASSDSETHTVRDFAIVKTRPNPAHTGQGVSVSVNLDLTPFNGLPAPTGTITVSDGTDSCVATLPVRECLWSSASEGLKQLQASYSGDGNYPALVSARVPLQIGPNGYPELLSVAQGVVLDANNPSTQNATSADGRFVAFASDASNLVPHDNNGQSDVFLRDMLSGRITRVSVSSSAVQGNNFSHTPAISADGRYVAFQSAANNLIAGDGNGFVDVFVHDTLTSVTTRVSVDSSGVEVNGASEYPALSADGRYVAFHSAASNLVAGDSNGQADIFLRDNVGGSTTRVSVVSGGGQATGGSSVLPAISADARFVAFPSNATNLVAGDSNSVPDIFVHDRQSNTTARVSVITGGGQAGGGGSGEVAISADGRYVAFSSDKTNLVGGDSNARADVFVHDRQTTTTTRASVDSAGLQGNNTSNAPGISADGRFVLFQSTATNLVAADSNGQSDIFLRDRQLSTTTRASVDSAAAQGNNFSQTPAISADGRYLTFSSFANNLIANDLNVTTDVFERDTVAGTTLLVSAVGDGAQGNRSSSNPAISANGRYASFQSSARNLVLNDSNNVDDIYRRDANLGTTTRVSVDSSGVQGNSTSANSAINADGRFVAFQSLATNLVLGDSNGQSDIFLHDTQTGVSTRVSVDSSGAQVNGASQFPALSSDGRYIAFESAANNLVAGDSNGQVDIFVRDTVGGSTTRVNVASGGAQATGGGSVLPAMSADARFVAFASNAPNLVAGDSNSFQDVFVHDRQTNTTTRVSVVTGGGQGTGGGSGELSISADGRYVAFSSDKTNLVGGDSNARADVFVHDRQLNTTVRASVDTAELQGNNTSNAPAISPDGRYVVFQSSANNLVAGDSNGQTDVFLRDMVAGTTVRLAVNRLGVEANSASTLTRFAASSNGLVVFSANASNLAAGDDGLSSDVFLTRIPNFVSATSTSTLITSDSPDPSVANTAYAVGVSVTRTAGVANVTGTVQLTDGQESCIATLSGSGPTAVGSCNLTSNSAGSKSLTATYSGDANYAPSVSVVEPHTVTVASVSGFSTTGDSPDPSRLERTVTYSWALSPAPIAPGRALAVPTGTVTVKEAANCAAAPVVAQHQCTATLPTSSCQIAFASVGIKNTVLCYSGDAAFAAASASESHEVIAASVPVSLAWLSAQRLDSNLVEVRFATAANVSTVAFDIARTALSGEPALRSSRSEAGVALSAASELLVSTGDSIRAANYSLRAALSGEQFYLRGFDASGAIESFGPFTVGSSSGTPPENDSAAVDWTARRSVVQASESARQSAALRTGSASLGVYLQVSQAGLQRLSAEALTSVGFTALEGTPVAELALTTVERLSNGSSVVRAVALQVNSSDTLWNAGDSVMFVGEPVDTQYSSARVYTFKRDPAHALRMSNVPSASATATAQTTLRQLPHSYPLVERKLFAPTSPGTTPWSWLRLAATTAPVTQTVTLQLPNAVNSAGLLTLVLHGGLDHDGAQLDHHVRIKLNDAELGELRFDGIRVYRQTFSVPAGVLREGANTLSLTLPADTGLPSDVIALESVTVEANARLIAQAGRLDLRLSLPSTTSPEGELPLFVSGFEALTSNCTSGTNCLRLALAGLAADAELVRVRGSLVERITGASLLNSELVVTLPTANGDRLLVANRNALLSPQIAAVPDSSSLLTGNAQYLVISHPSFANALASLLSARNAQGLTTKMLSTDQVYAAYSGGEVAPQAIQAYLKVAKAQLGTQYVLLVGGDTLDARGYQNSGSISFVPTLYRQTSPLIRFAPSDPALADVDGDGIQDLAIGRFPISSSTELAQVLAKTLTPNANNRALLVSDRSEPGLDFSAINQGLGALLPNYQVRRAERDQLSSEAVRQAIVEESNAGTRLIQYFGHASPARWSFDNVLTAAQIGSGIFTNQAKPVSVLQFACWTNYFVDPTHNTLGHAWLNQVAGASLVLGPSTLTETAHDEALATRLLSILNANPSKPLGQALLEAKQQLAVEQPGQSDVQLGVSLLGDPAGR